MRGGLGREQLAEAAVGSACPSPLPAQMSAPPSCLLHLLGPLQLAPASLIKADCRPLVPSTPDGAINIPGKINSPLLLPALQPPPCLLMPTLTPRSWGLGAAAARLGGWCPPCLPGPLGRVRRWQRC